MDPAVGFQHRRLIALQGMPIGEMWDVDELAQACVGDGTYECMLVSIPLNLPDGVGSPANAYEVKWCDVMWGLFFAGAQYAAPVYCPSDLKA